MASIDNFFTFVEKSNETEVISFENVLTKCIFLEETNFNIITPCIDLKEHD